MARLQILELPQGSGDDRPPFLLVLDQVDDELAEDIARWPDDIAKRIGARQVLCFPGTIDIPANDTTAYLDSDSRNEVTLKVSDQDIESIVESAERQTPQGPRPGKRVGIQPAAERTDIARDIDRLAKRRDELANALGLEQGSSWDDIRNTAAEFRSELIRSENTRERLRQERDKQAGELDQLRAGEEPGWDPAVEPTPGQWIARWNQSTPKDRLSMAAQILAAMPRANTCFMADHEAQIAHLRREIDQLRGTSANPDA